jgi:exopolysaccharide biosynthesis polyprenyl glycosylphosphotransferase
MSLYHGVRSVREFDVYDHMRGVVDNKTLEILDHRRRTAIVRRRGWLVRRALLVADVAGLVSAFALAEWIASNPHGSAFFYGGGEILAFLGSLPGWILIAKLYGLYERDEERTDHSTADDFGRVFHMVTVCTWLLWALSRSTGITHPTPAKLMIFWASAIALVTTGRAGARALARRSVTYLQNTVVVGAGDVGQMIARKLLQHPEYGINLVGFVDADPKERGDDLEHLCVLGGIENLPAAVRLLDVERVIIAFSNDSHEATIEVLRELKGLDVQIDIVPRLFEVVGPEVRLHAIEGLPLIGLPTLRLSRSSKLVKRLLDLVLSVVGLALGAPILVALAVAVKLDSRGPVLYRHRRVGYRGKPIDVFKFRTMRREVCRGDRYGGEAAEEEFARLLADTARAAEFATTYKLENDPRVTRVGRVLRKLSLDELPQLLNVLKGDLSLVGPRAITSDELDRYGDDVDTLLNIRPGVTGYWQINGRSRLSYEDRVRLDLSYIANWSLRLDLHIIAKTIRVLLSRHGAA